MSIIEVGKSKIVEVFNQMLAAETFKNIEFTVKIRVPSSMDTDKALEHAISILKSPTFSTNSDGHEVVSYHLNGVEDDNSGKASPKKG